MDNELNRYYMKILTILQNRYKDNSSRTLGPSAPSYTTVTRWAIRFRQGRNDVNDYPRSASPLSEFTGKNIQLVRQVINTDPHSTYDEIIHETSLSHGTIERIVHDCLKMKKLHLVGYPIN